MFYTSFISQLSWIRKLCITFVIPGPLSFTVILRKYLLSLFILDGLILLLLVRSSMISITWCSWLCCCCCFWCSESSTTLLQLKLSLYSIVKFIVTIPSHGVNFNALEIILRTTCFNLCISPLIIVLFNILHIWCILCWYVIFLTRAYRE